MTIRAEPRSFQTIRPAGPARSLIAYVVKALRNFWENQRNRRSVTTLLELDDRMLKDIGVTRYDVTSALSASPKDDPSAHLSQLCNERRHARYRDLGPFDVGNWMGGSRR